MVLEMILIAALLMLFLWIYDALSQTYHNTREALFNLRTEHAKLLRLVERLKEEVRDER